MPRFRSPEARERHSQAMRQFWKRRRESRPARSVEHAERASERRLYTTHGRPSEPTLEQIADAAWRLYAPRSLTATVFGDPPPGHSELDKKRRT